MRVTRHLMTAWMVLASACSVKDKVPGAGDAGVDAPLVDALVVDAPVVDAPVADAAPVDAAAVDTPVVDAATPDAPVIDAPVVDAPVVDASVVDASVVDVPVVDAIPVDATGSCAVGMTRCGGLCVDLSTDSANCGACGYEVRGPRTCAAGQPTPGWITMPIGPWPSEYLRIQSWTGRRFMVMTETQERFYDPLTNTWSADGAFARPPAAFNWTTSGEYMWAKIPGRDVVAIWDGTHTVDGDELWLFRDDGGPMTSWTPKASPLIGPRRGPTVVATASDVFVAWGYGFESVVRYDLTADTFVRSDQHALDCGGGNARWMNPLAIVAGSVVTHGGYQWNSGHCLATSATRADLPSMSAWATVPPNLGVRTGHILVEWHGRLMYGGGTGPGGGAGSCLAAGFGLVDLATGVANTSVNMFAEPPRGPKEAFVVRAGRSIIVWGGHDASCSGTSLSVYGTGSIGVPFTTGDNIAWQVLPHLNEPAARAAVPNGHAGWGSVQPMWTGYEAIVVGGTVGVDPRSGATYQPPVGCVCPSTDTEACAGVSSVPATCAPQ